MGDLKRPHFDTEAEEAAWYYDHREEVGRELVEASQSGRLGGGVAARARQLREAAATAVGTTLRFSQPVQERFRTSEQGWESRVDAALLEWMDEHKAS